MIRPECTDAVIRPKYFAFLKDWAVVQEARHETVLFCTAHVEATQ